MSGKDNAALVDATGTNSLDAKHAPLPLPATSFDIDVLRDLTNKAVNGAAAKRDEAIGAAIESAAADKDLLKAVDGASQPGYETVEVKHAVLEDVTEQARVFNPKLEQPDAAAPATEKE